MDYETFAKEYRRLFGLMSQYARTNREIHWAMEMSKLADSVPSEWVDRVEEEDG